MSMLECPKMCECKAYRLKKDDGTEDMHCYNPSDLIIEGCFNPVSNYDVVNAKLYEFGVV